MATERKCKFELYQDASREWRWRLRDTNGKIVADSAEGYSSREAAKAGIVDVQACASDADVVDG